MEDALAFGASGNLPGARAADANNVATIFNCCRTICAEPQQWQFEQRFFHHRALAWADLMERRTHLSGCVLLM